MEVLGKRVVAIKTAPRCKFCQSEHRETIDNLLMLRQLNRKDESGADITADYVLGKLSELGVPNPTYNNITSHKRHFELLDARVVDEIEQAESEAYAGLIAEAPTDLTAANVATWQVKLWMSRELARLRSGDGPSITSDQAQTAQKILIQAKADDATRILLTGLGAAIGAAMTGRELGEPPIVLELEAAEIAEVVEDDHTEVDNEGSEEEK